MVSLSLMTRDRETIQHPVTWEIGELMTEVSLRLLSIHGSGSCERFSMFFFWGVGGVQPTALIDEVFYLKMSSAYL